MMARITRAKSRDRLRDGVRLTKLQLESANERVRKLEKELETERRRRLESERGRERPVTSGVPRPGDTTEETFEVTDASLQRVVDELVDFFNDRKIAPPMGTTIMVYMIASSCRRFDDERTIDRTCEALRDAWRAERERWLLEKEQS